MNDSTTSSTASSLTGAPAFTPAVSGRPIADRRRQRSEDGGRNGFSERRQFGSSHAELSEAGRELALAIDQYKLEHHRRYITCDEMLLVLTELGYAKQTADAN